MKIKLKRILIHIYSFYTKKCTFCKQIRPRFFISYIRSHVLKILYKKKSTSQDFRMALRLNPTENEQWCKASLK